MSRVAMLWTGAGVIVVAVILYIAFSSSPTDGNDLQGAIGVAKQYRADQITDADVVLSDPEIQELLQSEFFYKLATDDEFRKVAVDQLARLDMSAGRHAQFASTTDLGNMKMFLDFALNDAQLKQALAEGRMNVVNEFLIRENRHEFLDVANRVYLVMGRNPQLNLAALGDMKMFLDRALGNAQLRMALAEGRMSAVNEALTADKHPHLLAAAQKVFVAENRRPHLDNAGLADMKIFLDFAAGNAELKAALADGRMGRVNEILLANNRTELFDAANRVYLAQARHPQLGNFAVADLKMFLDFAVQNRELKAALVDGRMERVNEILDANGKAALNDAAGKMHLTDRRNPHITAAGLADLKMFLDFAVSNADMKAALADGKMNIVHTALLANDKVQLADAANRIYSMQGQISINEAGLNEMKMFLDLASGRPDLKAAMVEGRMQKVDEALIADGKSQMCLAANRVYLIENRHPQLASYAELANMRAIADFAGDNAEFRQNLQDGRIDTAARLALSAERYDISLRHLQVTNFVIGEHRNFVPELNRLVAVAATPSFRAAAENAGFGRLVATSDAASWKQTMDAVADGKMIATH